MANALLIRHPGKVPRGHGKPSYAPTAGKKVAESVNQCRKVDTVGNDRSPPSGGTAAEVHQACTAASSSNQVEDIDAGEPAEDEPEDLTFEVNTAQLNYHQARTRLKK